VNQIGQCKDCINWSSRPEGRACIKTVTIYGGTVNGPSKAMAQSGDGNVACLETDPDFGCVQFESKVSRIRTKLEQALAALNRPEPDTSVGTMTVSGAGAVGIKIGG
jgi:hypothetical protein